jgi:hypothetical protein
MTNARARVKMTIEFPIPGGEWGPEWTIGQVIKQARESAKTCLMQGFVVDGLSNSLAHPKTTARIVEEPVITMVMVDDKE